MFPMDDGAARVIVTLMNIYRDRKRRGEPFTLADVVPGYAPQPEDVDSGASLFANLRKLQDTDG